MPSVVVLLVVDGFGVGALPDADGYGDEDADTLGHAAEVGSLDTPTLDRLGLGAIRAVSGLGADAVAAHGRMAERSSGKDSMTGHREIAGVVAERPFETFPDGFPAELVEALEEVIGHPVLGNVVSPGTDVVEAYGAEALRTGSPILYTSVDSVLQLAAHVDPVPAERLYEWCAQIRRIVGERIGRVIARPFTGRPGEFRRIHSGRRDFAVGLPEGSLLHLLRDAGTPAVAVGKVRDLFPRELFAETVGPGSDGDMIRAVGEWTHRLDRGLVFANVGDLDSKYAHRRDTEGWCRALGDLDRGIARLLERLGDDQVLAVTGDHGNDPTTPSTDHSREYVPVLAVTGGGWRRGGPGVDVGTRETFADLGATVAELLVGDASGLVGTSFAPDVP